MARMPAKVCAVTAQPNWAAVWHMFLLVLLLMSLLLSVVHVRAEGSAAVSNHLVAADGGFTGRASAGWYGSTSALQNHDFPSVPCGGESCCGSVCHAPAGLSMAAEIRVPGMAEHYSFVVAQAACEPASPGLFRPPIA